MEKENNLLDFFDQTTSETRTLFKSKLSDYGPSFLVLRPISLTDKLWIKTCRVRKLRESKKDRKIPEDSYQDCLSMINYSVLGLMMGQHGEKMPEIPDGIRNIDEDEIMCIYDEIIENNRKLMSNKTHDYDQAWQNMSTSTMLDFALEKVVRMKSLIKNGSTFTSEDLIDEYADTLNYTVMFLFLENQS